MAEANTGKDESDMIVFGLFSTICAIFLFSIGVKLIKSILSDSNQFKMFNPSKSHNWQSTEILNGAYFCTICELLVSVSEGLYCDACGVFVHPKCNKLANKKITCKIISQLGSEPMKHHWLRSNLPGDSICDVCEEDCESGPSRDVRCTWCRKTVHDHCRPNIAEVCDFGPFRSLVIPPTCVQVVHHKNRLRRRVVVKSITAPAWEGWSPIFVIASAKAGNSDAEHAASLFRGFLNPAQVVTLGRIKPEDALEWCRLLTDVRCRVLVAGGDGTVSWVLNTIQTMKLPNPPAVAILPFGTGNDLSRVLGWGSGVKAQNVDPIQVLDNLMAAQSVNLDRWSVRIQPSRSIPLTPGVKELFMYNYAGVGVDAQVALSFHRTRQSPWYLFNSRIFNKMLYVCFGTGEIIEKTYNNLQDRVDLYLDGVLVELPSIEGIVVLNIDSFGAGMHLWAMGNEDNPDGPYHSMCDKKLEVVAFYSSFHMGGLQMGVGLPYRVGQAKSVRIVLHREVALEVDGEPWQQAPAEIIFKWVNRQVMLESPV